LDTAERLVLSSIPDYFGFTVIVGLRIYLVYNALQRGKFLLDDMTLILHKKKPHTHQKWMKDAAYQGPFLHFV